jgi:glucose/arabinose dehydrogenase
MKNPGKLVAICVSIAVGVAEQAAASSPLQRTPNTTLAMPSAPPVFGFSSTNALGTLTFTNATAIASPPGETNRLFVVERRGRIVVVTNLAAPTRTVFMDISSRVTNATTDVGSDIYDERGLLGLAFHPQYASNGLFYVFYTGNATTPGVATNQLHDILSRFKVSASNPNQGDPTAEVRLIAQYDQAPNHNAGDLHFGPDDYLYVSLGDEGGAYG